MHTARLVMVGAMLAAAGCAAPNVPTSTGAAPDAQGPAASAPIAAADPAPAGGPDAALDPAFAADPTFAAPDQGAALAAAAGDAADALAPASLIAPPEAPFRLTGAPEPLDVIVAWKPGKAKAPNRGRLKRALKLADTELLEAADLAERDALLAELQADPDVAWAEPDHRLHALATANDPLLSYQWPIPKIGAPGAWDLGRGAGAMVAVIDTGVDASHPDLVGQVVAGPDLVHGDADPADDQGHGTHVAGTIAAIANNGVGVAGVAPAAKVLAVKVLGADGYGSTSDIADGVLAAVERGAQVLNLSLGGPYDSTALRTAVAQAQTAGAVVVAAAGNEGVDQRNYPAAYPGVLAVGATTSADARASFSNHGAWVTVAAPGDRVASTARGGGYVYMSGTSMATPHVAALAAMVRAKRPDWTLAQVRDAVQTTGAPATGFASSPTLRRIDALAAMKATASAATPAPTTAPTAAPTVAPTAVPTTAPTAVPTATPTASPTAAPTPTPAPSATPTPIASTAPKPDTTAPAIWTLKSSNVLATSATVSWTTSEAADGQVEYGRTTAFGSRSALATAYTTWHTFSLTGLTRGSTYYFRVKSKDKAGNLATSPTRTFKTAP